MIDEHPRRPDQARQHPSRFFLVPPAALQVSKTAILKRDKRGIIGREKGIQRYFKNVNKGRTLFPFPMEARYLP